MENTGDHFERAALDLSRGPPALEKPIFVVDRRFPRSLDGQPVTLDRRSSILVRPIGSLHGVEISLQWGSRHVRDGGWV
jgi:hypothetical protein